MANARKIPPLEYQEPTPDPALGPLGAHNPDKPEPTKPLMRSGLPSKKTFRLQMQLEGKWSKAMRFRDAKRKAIAKEFPAQCYKEINHDVWIMTLQNFWSSAFGPMPSRLLPPEKRDSVPEFIGMPVEGYEPQRMIRNMKGKEGFLEAVRQSSWEPAEATVRDDVNWVYANMLVSWDVLEVMSLPSLGAIGLLETAKDDPAWFYQNYHVKLLPTKSQLEKGDSLTDDESRIDELIKMVLTAEEMDRL